MSNEWKEGLFGCVGAIENPDDMMYCCASFLWPQAQLMYQIRTLEGGRKLEALDFCATCFCFPCMIFLQRREIEKKYEFRDQDKSLAIDCLAACYCSQCAVHQQTMELHKRDEKPAGLFMEK